MIADQATYGILARHMQHDDHAERPPIAGGKLPKHIRLHPGTGVPVVRGSEGG